MKLTQKANTATERVCLYGPPKVGKSLLAGKLAEHYKLLWIDCEKGWGVLKQLPPEWQERIEIISLPDSASFPIACETMLKLVKGSRCEVCSEHGKVSCAVCKKDGKHLDVIELNTLGPDTIVVWDSLSQWAQSCIAHITKGKADDYKMEFDDWGHLKKLVETFLSHIQTAPYNCVCITHEEEVEFEDKKKKIVPVCGSSKSSRNTAKYFDHVVYAEVRNKKHVAGSSTEYGMSIITGSRTGVAIEKSGEPTLLDIFTSWKGGFNGAEEMVRSVESSVGSNTSTSTISSNTKVLTKPVADTRTPGQIALDNMRAKQAVTSTMKGN